MKRSLWMLATVVVMLAVLVQAWRAETGAGVSATFPGTDGNDTFETPAEDYLVPVSLTPAGAVSNGISLTASISGSGKMVGFDSDASNIVANPSNGFSDVFIRNIPLATSLLGSVDLAGGSADNNSYAASLSNDGRFVAFQSQATDIAGGIQAGRIDIFRRDTQLLTNLLVSTASDGVNQPTSDSRYPQISGDGRFVVYESYATNLAANDTNNGRDIFLTDLTGGLTKRVSVATGGAQGNGESMNASMSPDARYVVFDSLASNLVAADTNSAGDIFIHDTTLGTTQRVSLNSAGVEGNSSSQDPVVSWDGRYVAFESFAANLVSSPPSNSGSEVYLRDRTASTTKMVSVGYSGAVNDSTAKKPSISINGRFVIFESAATNLVPADTNNKSDIFLRDTVKGITLRLSTDGLGNPGTDASFLSNARAISTDGRFVVFSTDATNLIPDDSNGKSDVVRVFNPLADGPDIYSGGKGDDTYILHGPAKIVELAGEGVDTVKTDMPAYALPNDVENLTYTGSGKFTGYGNSLGNKLIGGLGADIFIGLGGNDEYEVRAGDTVIEFANAGNDLATSFISYTLPANVERLTLAGTGNTNGTGNNQANTINGNSGINVLNGGAGSDTLKGFGGADIFLFNSKTGADTVLDLVTGTDKLRFKQTGIKVGSGDAVINGGVVLAGPGGFSATAELVIITKNIAGSITTTSAAAAIGSATAGYAAGRTALFAVDNGTASALFVFTSSGTDAAVSAAELQLLISLPNTASTALGDYQFAN